MPSASNSIQSSFEYVYRCNSSGIATSCSNYSHVQISSDNKLMWRLANQTYNSLGEANETESLLVRQSMFNGVWLRKGQMLITPMVRYACNWTVQSACALRFTLEMGRWKYSVHPRHNWTERNWTELNWSDGEFLKRLLLWINAAWAKLLYMD